MSTELNEIKSAVEDLTKNVNLILGQKTQEQKDMSVREQMRAELNELSEHLDMKIKEIKEQGKNQARQVLKKYQPLIDKMSKESSDRFYGTFENAGNGVGSVLGFTIKPFAKFGKGFSKALK